MNRIIGCILLAFLYCTVFAQNDNDMTILETRFRNALDTLTISKGPSPCIVVFVHSTCGNFKCATTQMQKALEQDSLDLRKNYSIKLYVVYPHEYSSEDVKHFDSYSPLNATVAFDINGQYRMSFGDYINATPFVVVFDGSGKRITQIGGTYQSLYDRIVQFLKPKVKIGLCEEKNNKSRCPNSNRTTLISQK